MAKDFTFNIPKIEVNLPSKGLIYKADKNGKPVSKVMLRAMTAQDENILHSPVYLQSGVAYTKVVQSCIVEPKGLNVADMLLGDANVLLFALRMLSYGNDFSSNNVLCPKCKKEFFQEFNLSKQDVKELSAEPSIPFENRFAFELPLSKINVEFKLETKTINNELDQILKALKKQKVEETVTTRLKHLIVSVDGEEDKKVINEFVDKYLTSKDSMELRKYMSKIAPSIDLKQLATCSECGEESEVDVPLDYTFLYPDKMAD